MKGLGIFLYNIDICLTKTVLYTGKSPFGAHLVL